MDLESALALLATHPLPALIAGLLLAALLAVMVVARLRQQLRAEQETLRHRLDGLWHELDELRMRGPASEGTAGAASGLEEERFRRQYPVWESVWEAAWTLHERVGNFLRAVENGESTADSRLSARNAALDARARVNRLRPFFDEQVDLLLGRVIDAEIKAHLAACEYLDRRSTEPDGRLESYRESFRLQHDGEAREAVNQLVAAIRQRLAGDR
ncbi:MAG: hypothetical protein R3280_06010 [Marinobacter sp.]|uniref:hypothetical protein n=1 Tax=Marinobacter sp. TaxID=50741 RepID=UPI00299CE640|nr:hypothetical protein [Marinobacter sp.]MDX1634169.1 hypothetical protein [Marinobacter sp.]